MATQTPTTPYIEGANGQQVMPRNDEQLMNGNFDVPEINNVTNQTGVIPADTITRNPQVTIPQINLSQTAQDASQALNEAEGQVAQQTELQRLTEARMAATGEQRLEQEALVKALGGNAQEIQQLFQQNEQAIAPIEQEVQNLNALIQAKTSALRQQLIDESGRPIPQPFVTGRKALIQQRASAEIADLGALLDAKNGQMQLAQQKLDRALQIQREVNNAEIQSQQVKIDLLREITGEAKEEEQKELDRLKEEQLKQEQAMRELKQLVIQNAGVIPTNIAQNALMNPDTDEGFNAILPYLGTEQRLDIALKQAQLSKAKQVSATTSNLKPSDITALKTLEGASDLKNAIKNYKEAFDEAGGKVQKKGRASAQSIETSYQEVLQAYRNAVDLGALQGADIGLVNSFIKEATFLRSEKKAKTQMPGFEVDRIGATKAKASKAAEASIEEAIGVADSILNRETQKIETSRPDLAQTSYYNGLVNGFDTTAYENDPSVPYTAGITALRSSSDITEQDIVDYVAIRFSNDSQLVYDLYADGYTPEEITNYLATQ